MRVLRIARIETADLAAYLVHLERGRAILRRLGVEAEIRVWRRRDGDPGAEGVTVTVEYPSPEAHAAGERAIAADPEYQRWFGVLERLRTIVADGLHDETA